VDRAAEPTAARDLGRGTEPQGIGRSAVGPAPNRRPGRTGPKGKGRALALLFRREGQQNQPVLYVREGLHGADRVLVDVNALAADGTRRSIGGTRRRRPPAGLRGFGRGAKNPLARARRGHRPGSAGPHSLDAGLLAGLAALGARLLLHTLPGAGLGADRQEQYQRRVFFHRLGSVASQDRLIFGEGLGASAWTSVLLSPTAAGWASRFPRAGQDRAFPHRHQEAWRALAILWSPADRRSSTWSTCSTIACTWSATRTRLATGCYRSIHASPNASTGSNHREGKDTLEWVARGGKAGRALSERRIFARARVLARRQVGARDQAAGLGHGDGLHGRHQARELFFGFTSFLTPTAVVRHDLGTGRSTVWQKLASPIDPEAFSVEQVRYPSKDGTLVPMFLVARKGLVRDGRAPALLYAMVAST